MSDPKHRPKVCILIETLAKGGAERMAGNLSFLLQEIGFEVTVVVIYDDVSYRYAGTSLNLGYGDHRDGNFLYKAIKYNRLQRSIKRGKYDLIIDFRMRTHALRELIFLLFLFPLRKTIFRIATSVHDWYLPSPMWLFKPLYAKSLGILGVSEGITQQIRQRFQLSNVFTIYNPLDVNRTKDLSQAEKPPSDLYVIAVGRMSQDNQKQFDKLIEAYSKSTLPRTGILLRILGEGVQKPALIRIAEEKGLQDLIVFEGFTENPYPYMRGALFLALTSEHEGLPGVLLESLACGTPVVAFDCPTGPREIVVHEQNGLLVPDQDLKEMSKAMSRMIADRELYLLCQKNSQASISKFEKEHIKAEWLTFLESKGYSLPSSN